MKSFSRGSAMDKEFNVGDVVLIVGQFTKYGRTGVVVGHTEWSKGTVYNTVHLDPTQHIAYPQLMGFLDEELCHLEELET